jgi:ethanolamine ammonia-lyase small subunit
MSASRRTVAVAANAAPLAALLAATPARLAIGRTGPRLPAAAYLAMVADHARARDAITSEVPAAFARKLGLTEISTRAHTRAEYVRVPALGRTLDALAIARLRRCRHRPEVQLALTDGLSSAAIVANGPPLLRALRRRLLRRGRRLGTPLFVRNGRVRVQDEIGAILRPEVFCFLVGERPGLATAESVSAYVIYRPTRRSAEPDRTVISNIHRGGVTPAAAARELADLIDEILERGASGAALAAARAHDDISGRPSR